MKTFALEYCKSAIIFLIVAAFINTEQIIGFDIMPAVDETEFPSVSLYFKKFKDLTSNPSMHAYLELQQMQSSLHQKSDVDDYLYDISKNNHLSSLYRESCCHYLQAKARLLLGCDLLDVDGDKIFSDEELVELDPSLNTQLLLGLHYRKTGSLLKAFQTLKYLHILPHGAYEAAKTGFALAQQEHDPEKAIDILQPCSQWINSLQSSDKTTHIQELSKQITALLGDLSKQTPPLTAITTSPSACAAATPTIDISEQSRSLPLAHITLEFLQESPENLRSALLSILNHLQKNPADLGSFTKRLAIIKHLSPEKSLTPSIQKNMRHTYQIVNAAIKKRHAVTEEEYSALSTCALLTCNQETIQECINTLSINPWLAHTFIVQKTRFGLIDLKLRNKKYSRKELIGNLFDLMKDLPEPSPVKNSNPTNKRLALDYVLMLMEEESSQNQDSDKEEYGLTRLAELVPTSAYFADKLCCDIQEYNVQKPKNSSQKRRLTISLTQKALEFPDQSHTAQSKMLATLSKNCVEEMDYDTPITIARELCKRDASILRPSIKALFELCEQLPDESLKQKRLSLIDEFITLLPTETDYDQAMLTEIKLRRFGLFEKDPDKAHLKSIVRDYIRYGKHGVYKENFIVSKETILALCDLLKKPEDFDAESFSFAAHFALRIHRLMEQAPHSSSFSLEERAKIKEIVDCIAPKLPSLVQTGGLYGIRNALDFTRDSNKSRALVNTMANTMCAPQNVRTGKQWLSYLSSHFFTHSDPINILYTFAKLCDDGQTLLSLKTFPAIVDQKIVDFNKLETVKIYFKGICEDIDTNALRNYEFFDLYSFVLMIESQELRKQAAQLYETDQNNPEIETCLKKIGHNIDHIMLFLQKKPTDNCTAHFVNCVQNYAHTAARFLKKPAIAANAVSDYAKSLKTTVKSSAVVQNQMNKLRLLELFIRNDINPTDANTSKINILLYQFLANGTNRPAAHLPKGHHYTWLIDPNDAFIAIFCDAKSASDLQALKKMFVQ